LSRDHYEFQGAFDFAGARCLADFIPCRDDLVIIEMAIFGTML